jgi:hypothetical protein
MFVAYNAFKMFCDNALHHCCQCVINVIAQVTGAGVAQSVQCLATDWTTGRSGFDPRQGQSIFSLFSVSRPALRPTQPPVQLVSGSLSPGHDADH